jgi:hypothetical protein
MLVGVLVEAMACDYGMLHALPNPKSLLPVGYFPIRRYRHARPALLFHATNDKSEKSICCMGFRKEFQGSASGVLGMIGNGVYFSTLPM